MMPCIPSYFKLLSHPPYYRIPFKNGKWIAPLTDIYIKMRDVQVISIGMNTVTVSMNFRTAWLDYRLENWNYPPKVYGNWIWLNEEFKNLVWMPTIITDKLVSEKEVDEKFGLWRLRNNSIPLVFRKFYLHTTVNCAMDFQTFPFDKHVCNIEVIKFSFKEF